jgi:hypothetical protein
LSIAAYIVGTPSKTRHAVALEDLQRLAAVEARNQRQAPADGHRGVERAGLAEGVEERQRTERHRALVEPEQPHAHLDVAQQVAVRELGALRLPRRARRVEDHRRVVGIPLDHVGRGLAAREQRLELARLHEHALGPRLLGAALRGVRELMPREDQLRVRVTEVEGDLAVLQQRVHRHDSRARAQRAVVADREVRDVRQHDPDAVARPDALGPQQAGDPRGGLVERGVRQLAVVHLDRHAVGARGDAAGE